MLGRVWERIDGLISGAKARGYGWDLVVRFRERPLTPLEACSAREEADEFRPGEK